MYITLDEAKEQVSVELDNPNHDDRLTRLIAAAERWAKNYLNVETLDDFYDSPIESPASLPEDLKSGLLLHIEMEFDRDERNMELLLKRAEQLLWPYREGLGV